ncbi:acyl-CoA dehydrogenase family protein [Nocardiopsis sediminis]|uniref:Acyl-CoA dehydrogenase family protein n=1 Tax=Nocardiopsis sediminis TaxID=1778267 RepID=A0ABV8FRK3_9ACTN
MSEPAPPVVHAPPVAAGITRLSAEAARATAAGHAAAADRERRLTGDVVSAITDAGFARHFAPREFGGAEGTFTDYLHGTAALAQGCASAAWCASVIGSACRAAAYLPAEGRSEVWADGPDTIVCVGVVPSPSVEVERIEGGWALSGAWHFVSGVDFADWLLLAGREPGPEVRVRWFAVPRTAIGVEDTWFTAGMRGTGSKTVHADTVFVPEHRSFDQEVLLSGAAPLPSGPGARGRAPCHSAPFRLINGLTMIGPALGAARAGVDSWAGWVAQKTEPAMGRRVRAADRGSVQAALARSSAAVDAVELLIGRTAALADSGTPVPDADIARSHRDYAVAAEYLADAVEGVFRASGANGQADDNPVQRAWRDVHAAVSHAALRFDTGAAAYARSALGTGARPGPGSNRSSEESPR